MDRAMGTFTKSTTNSLPELGHDIYLANKLKPRVVLRLVVILKYPLLKYRP